MKNNVKVTLIVESDEVVLTYRTEQLAALHLMAVVLPTVTGICFDKELVTQLTFEEIKKKEG